MISDSFTFSETLKVVLMNMVEVLMMSAKWDTLGLLRIKIFWNKGYDIVIFAHNVTNKITWLKFYCTYGHATKITNLSRYINFFDRYSWFKFSNLGLALGTTLKIFTSVAEDLKLKVLGDISHVSKRYRGELGKMKIFSPPSPSPPSSFCVG